MKQFQTHCDVNPAVECTWTSRDGDFTGNTVQPKPSCLSNEESSGLGFLSPRRPQDTTKPPEDTFPGVLRFVAVSCEIFRFFGVRCGIF